MRAWQLERMGGRLEFTDVPIPEARPGSVVVRMEAASLMSYMKDYAEGKLPIYHVPQGKFIPGGNGVGAIHAVGRDVWHLKVGQRVVLSSYFVAQENVQDPAQILIGITAHGPVARTGSGRLAQRNFGRICIAAGRLVTLADVLQIVISPLVRRHTPSEELSS